MDLKALSNLRNQAYGRMMAALKKGIEGQPEVNMVDQIDGSSVPEVSHVFITSVESLMNDISPGAVVSVLPRLAARLIAQGSHRLSTKAEIDGFYKLQVRNKIDDNERDLAAMSTSRTVIVNGVPGEGVPLELPEHLKKFAPSLAPSLKSANNKEKV